MCGLKKNCDIYSAQNLFEGAKSKDFLEIFEVGIQDHDYLYHTDMGGGGVYNWATFDMSPLPVNGCIIMDIQLLQQPFP